MAISVVYPVLAPVFGIIGVNHTFQSTINQRIGQWSLQESWVGHFYIAKHCPVNPPNIHGLKLELETQVLVHIF